MMPPTSPVTGRRRFPGWLLLALPLVALTMGVCSFMDPDDRRLTLPPCTDARTGQRLTLTPEGAPTVADSAHIARENAAGRQVYPLPGVQCANSEALTDGGLQRPGLLAAAVLLALLWAGLLLLGRRDDGDDGDAGTPRGPRGPSAPTTPTSPPTFVPPAPFRPPTRPDAGR